MTAGSLGQLVAPAIILLIGVFGGPELARGHWGTVFAPLEGDDAATIERRAKGMKRVERSYQVVLALAAVLAWRLMSS